MFSIASLLTEKHKETLQILNLKIKSNPIIILVKDRVCNRYTKDGANASFCKAYECLKVNFIFDRKSSTLFSTSK